MTSPRKPNQQNQSNQQPQAYPATHQSIKEGLARGRRARTSRTDMSSEMSSQPYSDGANHAGESTSSPRRRTVNRRLLIVSGTLAVVVVPVCFFWHSIQVQRSSSALLDRAEKLQKEGKSGEATQQIQLYSGLTGGNNVSRQKMIEILQAKPQKSKGEWEKLTRLIAEVLSSEPTRTDLRIQLATALYEAGFYERAVHESEALLQKDPKDLTAQHVLADSLFALKRFEQAKGNYAKIVEQDGNDIERTTKLAGCYLQLGEPQRAGWIIDEMVTRNPQNAMAYYRRYLYRLSKKDKNAGADLDTALELAPTDPQILLAAASSAAQQKDWGKTEQLFARAADAAEADPTLLSLAYLGEGNAQIAQRNPAGAIATFNEALAKTGANNLQINLRLAEVLLAQDNVAEAEPHLVLLKTTLKSIISEQGQKSSDVVSLTQLVNWLEAQHLLATKEHQKALPLLLECSKANVGDPAITYQALQRLGNVYSKLGQWDAAANAFQRAAALRPDQIVNRLNAGRALITCGRHEAAHQMLAPLTTPENLTPPVAMIVAKCELHRQADRPNARQDWRLFDRCIELLEEQGPLTIAAVVMKAERQAADGEPNLGLATLARAQWQTAQTKAIQMITHPAQVVVEATQSNEITKKALANVGPSLRQLERNTTRGLLRDSAQLWISAAENMHARKLAVTKPFLAAAAWVFPDNSSIWMTRATALFLRGESKAAADCLAMGLNSVEADQQLPLLHLQCMLLPNNSPEQIATYEQIVMMRPRLAQPRYDLWNALRLSGQNDRAQKALTELREVEGESGTYWRCAAAVQMASQPNPEPETIRTARAMTEQLLDQRPTWTQAYLAKAVVARASGNADEEIDALKAAIDIGERDSFVFHTMLERLAEQGRWQEADQYLDRIKKDLITRPSLLPLAVHISLENKHFSEAEVLARDAVTKNPNSAPAQMWLAQVLAVGEKPDEASLHFEKAIAIAPSAVPQRIAYIRHLVKVKQPEKAREQIEEFRTRLIATDDKANSSESSTTKSDSKVNTPELIIAYCYSLTDDQPQAKQAYLAAMKKYPENELVLRSAASYFLRHSMPEADQAVALLHAQSPKDQEVRRVRAMQMLKNNDVAGWQSALDLIGDQNQAIDLRLRAMLLLRLNGPENRQEAIRCYERILQQAAEVTTQDRWQVARLYRENGQLDKALDNLLVGVYQPDAPAGMRQYCVELCLDMGRWEGDAATLLHQLEESDTANLQTIRLRGKWFVASGRNEQADEFLLEQLQKAEGSRTFPKTLMGIAQCLVELGNTEQGEKLYRRLAAEYPRHFEPLVMFLAEQNRGGEAIAGCLEQAKSNEPQWRETALAIAATIPEIATVDAKDEAAVVHALEAEAKAQPKSRLVVAALGSRYLLRGDYEKASQIFAQLTKANPKDAASWNNLALAEIKCGRARESQNAIAQAIAIAGPQLELLDSKGMILLESGNVNGALNVFETLAADPRATAIHHLHLSYALSKANRVAESRTALSVAQKRQLDPKKLSKDDSLIFRKLKSQG